MRAGNAVSEDEGTQWDTSFLVGGGRNVSWMHATEEPALNAPGESLAVPETRTFEYIEES